MHIDHDRNELPRRALKVVAAVAVLLTIAAVIPINFGIRWIVEQLPTEAIFLFDGALAGMGAGYYLGRWDARRQFRTNGREA